MGILAGLAGAVSPGRAESGIAAVYSYRGGRTASGERARPAELTAAHRMLTTTLLFLLDSAEGRVRFLLILSSLLLILLILLFSFSFFSFSISSFSFS